MAKKRKSSGEASTTVWWRCTSKPEPSVKDPKESDEQKPKPQERKSSATATSATTTTTTTTGTGTIKRSAEGTAAAASATTTTTTIKRSAEGTAATATTIKRSAEGTATATTTTGTIKRSAEGTAATATATKRSATAAAATTGTGRLGALNDPMLPSRKSKAPSLSTRKRKKSAEIWPRKRPKKPSVNTCSEAKSRTITEFIGNNHGGNASVKLAALQGLCLISEEHKWSIKCPVCNAVLRTKIMVDFDLCKPVSQVDRDGKYAVRLIRQHCAREHPDTFLWNVVPPTRIREGDGIPPGEHFLHQALKAGGLIGYIPKQLTKREFSLAFSVRTASAICWIRWSRMMNKSLNKLQRIEALREDATRRIENILDNGMARIWSTDFAKVLETHTLDQAFNKLMLFFCKMGQYRYCPVFGMESNELKAVAMLNSRLTRGESEH